MTNVGQADVLINFNICINAATNCFKVESQALSSPCNPSVESVNGWKCHGKAKGLFGARPRPWALTSCRSVVHQAIHSVAWHHEGKQFICSHSDGTLTIWNVRGQGKPVQTITPHGKDTETLPRANAQTHMHTHACALFCWPPFIIK